MKKSLSVILTFIFVFIFVSPVSAKTNNEATFEQLNAAADQIIGNQFEASFAKDALSSTEIEYLESKGIDSEQIVKVYYRVDGDCPCIDVVTNEGDNALGVTSLLSFKPDKSGKFERIRIPDSQTRGSWYTNYLSGNETVGAITIAVKVDYNYYIYNNDIAYVYYRPYQAAAKYYNNSGSHTVTKLSVYAVFYGDEFTYSGDVFNFYAYDYYWRTHVYVASPSHNYYYYQSNAMIYGHCMVLSGASYYGSVTIDGQSYNINYGLLG